MRTAERSACVSVRFSVSVLPVSHATARALDHDLDRDASRRRGSAARPDLIAADVDGDRLACGPVTTLTLWIVPPPNGSLIFASAAGSVLERRIARSSARPPGRRPAAAATSTDAERETARAYATAAAAAVRRSRPPPWEFLARAPQGVDRVTRASYEPPSCSEIVPVPCRALLNVGIRFPCIFARRDFIALLPGPASAACPRKSISGDGAPASARDELGVLRQRRRRRGALGGLVVAQARRRSPRRRG